MEEGLKMVRLRKEWEQTGRRWPNVRGDPNGKGEGKLAMFGFNFLKCKEVKR
jgi:hypothetical protein